MTTGVRTADNRRNDLSVFPWALFRSTRSAVKLHALPDLWGNIPTFIHVSDGKTHDP